MVGLIAALIFGLTAGFFYSLGHGLAYAVTFGLAVGFAGAFGRIREPSRVRITFRGHGSSLLRRLTASLVVGFVMAAVAGAVNGIAVAGAFAVALATHLLLDSAPDETAAASPAHSLRQDRSGALLLGAALLFTFGVVPGVLSDPASMPGLTMPVTITTRLIEIFGGAVVGTVMGGFLFGRIGAITIGIAGAMAGGLGLVRGFEFQGQDSQAALAYSIFFGIGISLLGVLTRAWGAYTLVRLWLTLRGRLPLRLMRFLKDAHRRGVLRQSGTTYQFRHERLHNHIITTARRGAARVPSDVVISDRVPAADVAPLADAPGRGRPGG